MTTFSEAALAVPGREMKRRSARTVAKSASVRRSDFDETPSGRRCSPLAMSCLLTAGTPCMGHDDGGTGPPRAGRNGGQTRTGSGERDPACRWAVACSVVRVGDERHGEYGTDLPDRATADGTVGRERWARCIRAPPGSRDTWRMSASGQTRPMRRNTRDHRSEPGPRPSCLGDRAERLAAARLVDAGWTILATNVRVGRDELDLVAVDPGPPASLVVVEVRWRRGAASAWPRRRSTGASAPICARRLGRLVAGGGLPDGQPLPRAADAGGPRRGRAACGPGGPPRLRHHRAALAG